LLLNGLSELDIETARELVASTAPFLALDGVDRLEAESERVLQNILGLLCLESHVRDAVDDEEPSQHIRRQIDRTYKNLNNAIELGPTEGHHNEAERIEILEDGW
jgi:hypothetical protein